jgi:hypothetical protein
MLTNRTPGDRLTTKWYNRHILTARFMRFLNDFCFALTIVILRTTTIMEPQ